MDDRFWLHAPVFIGIPLPGLRGTNALASVFKGLPKPGGAQGALSPSLSKKGTKGFAPARSLSFADGGPGKGPGITTTPSAASKGCRSAAAGELHEDSGGDVPAEVPLSDVACVGGCNFAARSKTSSSFTALLLAQLLSIDATAAVAAE